MKNQSFAVVSCWAGLVAALGCSASGTASPSAEAQGGSAVAGTTAEGTAGSGSPSGGSPSGGTDSAEGGSGSLGGVSPGGTSTGGTPSAGAGAGGVAGEAPIVLDYGDLDPTRLPAEPWKNTEWRDPGGWTAVDVAEHGLLPNDASIDASKKLTEIIAATSGRRKLQFPPGTFHFKTTLTVSTGDLWLLGSGEDRTVFSIDAPGADNAELRFSGGALQAPIALTEAAAPGDDELVLADASSLNPGDVVMLFADDAPLLRGGQAWNLQVYSQLVRVLEKDGNRVRLDMKVLLDYPLSFTPVVRRLRPIRNVRLEGFKVRRVNEPSIENVSNLLFRSVDNALVTRVESELSGRSHVSFEYAKDCVVTDSYVHDTWKAQTGGYGYGLGLAVSTGCRFSNNKTARLRHQIILQAGANHNVVSYNSVEAPLHYNDLALHATYAYFNLMEGNSFTEGFSDSSKDGYDDAEPTTGPGNTWFRNYVMSYVGNVQKNTRRQNMIGNVTASVRAVGSDHYVGANGLPPNIDWRAFTEASVIPPSLYLTSAPDFWVPNAPFPSFGPGVPGFGQTNQLPARLRLPRGQKSLLQGASFEQELAGWSGGGDVFGTSSDAHSGARSLALVGTGGWANLQQSIKLTAGRRYTLSYWAKTKAAGGRVKVIASGDVNLQDCGSTVASAHWRQYFCNFDSGSVTSARVYIGDGGGDQLFDDFEIY